MERYVQNSKIKKIRAKKGDEELIFFAEIIEDPVKSIQEIDKPRAISEIKELIKRSWGEFEENYIENSILTTFRLLVLRDEKEKLVGVAPVKKLKIKNRTIYSFGLSVVDPKYQGLGLLKTMYKIITKKIFIENLLCGKSKVEFLFITPNINTMGTLARLATFMYPNPYNMEDGKIESADSETWETVNEYLSQVGEKNRKLNREGCVMTGFYEDKKHLIQKISSHEEKKFDEFAKKYLKPGDEIVVRAIIGIKRVIKNGS